MICHMISSTLLMIVNHQKVTPLMEICLRAVITKPREPPAKTMTAVQKKKGAKNDLIGKNMMSLGKIKPL